MQLTTSCAVICLIHALTCMAWPSDRFEREGSSEEISSSEETDSSEVLRCPDGWFQYGKSCYIEGRNYKTWDEARMSCQAQDSDLVEINNQAELEFISRLPNLGSSTLWTGLTDSDMEGYFVWISSGNSLSFSNWDTNEPYGTDDLYDCVLSRGLDGWLTEKCDVTYEYLCESRADMSDSR